MLAETIVPHLFTAYASICFSQDLKEKPGIFRASVRPTERSQYASALDHAVFDAAVFRANARDLIMILQLIGDLVPAEHVFVDPGVPDPGHRAVELVSVRTDDLASDPRSIWMRGVRHRQERHSFYQGSEHWSSSHRGFPAPVPMCTIPRFLPGKTARFLL